MWVLSAAGLAAGEPAWPCYHGPQRNNLSAETGLLRAWPPDGPRLIWTASGIGHGYSTVAIAAGRIFTSGMIDKQTHVTALDLGGEVLWQRLNGQSWEATQQQPWAVPYSGARGTPTVDGDMVYHLSELGRLTAFDARSGREQWHVDTILDEQGTLSLVKAAPEAWEVVGSFPVPRGGRGQYWAHPVVCGGRLYVRHGEQLFAYDVRRNEP